MYLCNEFQILSCMNLIGRKHESMQQREVWIDFAKFISIFLVVLFHTNPNLDGYIFEFLRLLRMPAFFLIAGLLFNIEKWNSFTKFLEYRFRRLIIPYFWFSLIFYLLCLFIGRNMVGEEELSIHVLTPVKEFILGKPSIVLAPYWFITCLFTIQMLFYCLKRWIKSNYIIIIISIFCYLAALYLNITNLPWCIDRAFCYLPFYAYANILREHKDSPLLNKTRYIIVPTIASLAILMANSYFIKSEGISYLLYVISGFAIMPAYIVFCKHLAAISTSTGFKNAITYIGDNNIITLALQNYIIGFIKILATSLFAINILTTNHYSINIAITIATIVCSMFVALFVNKFTPFVIGKRAIKKTSPK